MVGRPARELLTLNGRQGVGFSVLFGLSHAKQEHKDRLKESIFGL
jgi:hypothetical protein